MMRPRCLRIGEKNIIYLFIILCLVGYLFATFDNLLLILIGLSLLLLGLHELGHIWALLNRGYHFVGITYSIFGVGVLPDRPIEKKDVSMVYLSGLVTLLMPILVTFMSPENFIAILVTSLMAIVLSIHDIYIWWRARARDRNWREYAILLGVAIGLLCSIVLMTENPSSHFCEIEVRKWFQFEIMRNINSTSTKQRMRVLFDHDYNYIELIRWTHSQINFSDSKPDPVPKDPLDIIELGHGRCGEFSILYASACLAHGYNTRLVIILRGSGHEWVEVQIDGEWIHVDPSYYPEIHVNEPEMYKERNKTLYLVVAFEENKLEVVTDKYQ